MFSVFRCFIKRDVNKINKKLLSVINQRNSHAKMSEKVRKNPIVTKLETPEFKSIFTPELEVLSSLFKKYNYEIRIAGGAVRDLLLKQVPKDIDFATNATPDQMKEMFTTEEIRMINMKGEKHGTITARINDKENFEITTLRVDVVTDGRHAEVEFTKDWLLDANRRDLTINSMFLDLDGSVYDYFFGYEDLQQRKVVFVGDADTRIKEDYLRILRYFRFYGRIAEKPDNHDIATLQTIRENVSGLERISSERIWSELKRILEGRYVAELIKVMIDVGVMKYCGLEPDSVCLDDFTKLWQRSGHLSLHPITLLAGLISNAEDWLRLSEKLKMSTFDRDLGLFIVQNRIVIPDLKPLLTYKKLVVNNRGKQANTKIYTCELLKYKGEESLLKEFSAWEVPRMPVSGTLLRESCNIPSGRFMGIVMDKLKAYWVDREFIPDREELLAQVPEILSLLDEKKKPNK